MTETHTARAHAKLAPSASHRWMHCPASVRATEGLPDDTSEAAAEGTAAHELCSHCLLTGDAPGTFLDMWVDIHAKEGKARFVNLDSSPEGDDAMRFFQVDEEMVDAVEMYVDHVGSLMPPTVDPELCGMFLEVEQRLDITHIHKDIFGTGDALVYDEARQHLHVVDFKYGRGVVVDADENPQLILYATGAARRYHNRQIAKLTAHIIQPRASHPKGPIRSYEFDLIELFEQEDMLAEAAKRTEDPDAPFAAGHWCHDSFCKLQATCAHNRKHRLEMAGAEFGSVDVETKFPDPNDLTLEQRARVMREADSLLSFVKAVQQNEHNRAMNGSILPDFKLVAKRATRKWKDQAEAEEAMLLHAIEPYQPAKLKSPAMAEGGFAGKNKEQRQAAMAHLVTKVSSGYNLVPLSHPGVAVNVGAGADFEVVDV